MLTTPSVAPKSVTYPHQSSQADSTASMTSLSISVRTVSAFLFLLWGLLTNSAFLLQLCSATLLAGRHNVQQRLPKAGTGRGEDAHAHKQSEVYQRSPLRRGQREVTVAQDVITGLLQEVLP